MSEFDWLSVLPMVFAAPFFAFALLNWRAASTLGSLVYLVLLSVGTTLTCLLLAAQPSLRSYCGAALALSVVLAFVARQKLSGNAVVVAMNRFANRSLIGSAMLYPVAVGIWLLLAWRQLSAAPDYGDPSIPFRLGWLPPDWLGLYPNALAAAALVAIGVVIWRLDAPVSHPGVVEALGGLRAVYFFLHFSVAIGIFVEVRAISADQALGWMTFFLSGILVFAFLDRGGVVARTPDELLAPLVDASSPHWRYRYFYWNPEEVSPSVRTNGGYGSAVNWASPVAWLQQLLPFFSAILVLLW